MRTACFPVNISSEQTEVKFDEKYQITGHVGLRSRERDFSGSFSKKLLGITESFCILIEVALT